MSLQEVEAAVMRLSPADREAFAQWFEEFKADEWDRQIEMDIAAGKLDALGKKADADFESGRCKPLCAILPIQISGFTTAGCRRKFVISLMNHQHEEIIAKG